MATVTKMHLADKLFEAGVGNLAESANILDLTLDLIKDTLAGGENVLLSGFGKFRVREKKARQGRNPKTGEPMTVAPRRVVTFHPSGELRQRCKRSEREAAGSEVDQPSTP